MIKAGKMKKPGLLSRFIAYYKPFTLMFSLDIAASMLISLIGMVYPVITREMLNNYIPNKLFKSIVISGIVVLVLYIVRMLLRFFVQYYGHKIGVGMQANMRSDLFKHLEKLPFSFYDDHETGSIMTRMTSDLFEVAELAHHGPENLITCSVMIILSFIYLCTISVPLTLIVFVCVPILFAVSLYYRTKMREAFSDRRKSNAVINASLESSISGIRVTKAYTNSEKEIEKFEVGNGQFVDASYRSYNAMGKFFASTGFITDVFNVIILIAGGLFLYAGEIDFGDYSAFIVSVSLFISPVTTLLGFMEQYQNGVTGFKRFAELMEVDPELSKEGAESLEDPKGEIELCNVTFAYKDSKTVLDSVSLKVEPGKKLALVGPSGGGKTTICHLIPNFYKIAEDCGCIKIDGRDIREFTLESVRKAIGIVQQDVFLFAGSIRDNIRYGKLDATDEEIELAARRANIHDYIMKLENGYDTDIGERGVKLSGGQKQRLSIARVFLKNPAILILDEATSALDNTTELMIQQSLDELCKGRTTIIVAHRLSTIRNADEIAVITEGKVLERGSHNDLIALDGVYKSLYDLQFRIDGE